MNTKSDIIRKQTKGVLLENKVNKKYYPSRHDLKAYVSVDYVDI
jgi:hypothetical protein